MIEAITLKMIQHSQGNRHDIQHFLKVWAYARTIGFAEKLNDENRRYWKLPLYATILPVRFVVRKMVVRWEKIRSVKGRK